MRYLHPVQMHEKFVASGRYACYSQLRMEEARVADWQTKGAIEIMLEHDFGEDGRFYRGFVPDAWIEEWAIHELPDQSRLIRCDRYIRTDPVKTALLGEILQRSDGEIERIDLRCYDEAQLFLEASYLFFETEVLIGRRHLEHSGSMTEREQFEYPLPAGYIVDSGLFTITRGFAFQKMFKQLQAANATPFTMFAPGYLQYEDLDIVAEHWLRGETRFFYALKYLGKDTVTIQGQVRSGEVYTWAESSELMADHLDFDASVMSISPLSPLLDDKGIPLRFPQSSNQVDRLEQYAHRPELKRKS